jgi:hypothetical protein
LTWPKFSSKLGAAFREFGAPKYFLYFKVRRLVSIRNAN